MADEKPACKYGASCYRRNPQHFQQFSHPQLTDDDSEDRCSQSDDEGTRKRVREECETEESSKSKRSPPQDMPSVAAAEGQEEEVDCDDVRANVKRKFLVQMPEDFYQFWEFCNELSPSDDPLSALSSTLQLSLVGPYHELAGRLSNRSWTQCVLHYRYFYDPPELVTVLARQDDSTGATNGFHIGYYRDDPSDVNGSFMVANTSSEGCALTHVGLNIFAAVKNEVVKKLKSKGVSKGSKEELKSLESSLVKKAEELGLNIKSMKPAGRKIVTKCFNGIGMSVPVDPQLEIGYRPLTMTNKELHKLLDKIATCTNDSTLVSLQESLQELITFVQFANDECDYGMGLELGTDLYCHGDHFHDHVRHILPLAYELLRREEYGKIILEHLKNRQRHPLDFTK